VLASTVLLVLWTSKTILASLALADARLLDDRRDVDQSIGSALDGFLVFLDFFHLPSDALMIEMGRHLHAFEAFHQFFVFNVDSLGLSLLVVEVETALLLDGARAVDHRARAHVRLQQRMV